MPSKKPTAKSSPAKAKPDSISMTGKKAPSFTLPDAGGKAHSLAQLLKGKNLVLYFYPKDMTPGCTVEACSFRDNIKQIRALGAEVVGISGDSEASHSRFRDKHELNFPLLADVGNNVAKQFGVYRMKSLYGREYIGIVRSTFIIDRSGIVRREFPKVKVNGHTEEVVAALKEIR
jgi:peroxiredoxin Q/BCP